MPNRFNPDDAADASLDGIAKISRVTLHGSVLNQLRDMIIEGKLAPGSRINESQLGLVLGVSRTPLREAIKSLAGEGLLEIRPARGAIVRSFSEQDVRDILEVLTIIEVSAGRLLCARGKEDDIRVIEALHASMLERYEKRDRLAYFKLNQEIHTAIVRASGNPVLLESHEQLQARIKRIRFVGNDTPEGWSGAVDEHQRMVDAMRQRDGEALAKVIEVHLSHTMDRVRGTLTRE